MDNKKLIEALEAHADLDLLCGRCMYEGTSDCGQRMAVDALSYIKSLCTALAERDRQITAAVELQQSILEQTENLDGVTNYGDGPVDTDEALCRLNLIARMVHGHRVCFSGPQEAMEGRR